MYDRSLRLIDAYLSPFLVPCFSLFGTKVTAGLRESGLRSREKSGLNSGEGLNEFD